MCTTNVHRQRQVVWQCTNCVQLGCVIPPILYYIWVASISSGHLLYEDHWNTNFALEIYVFKSPQKGYSVKKGVKLFSPKCPLWVVYTCISRCLNQCKRNQLNRITQSGVNVNYVVRFSCFWQISKYPIFGAHFGRFLWTGLSDRTDSFFIESGILRHKFRLPTRGILDTMILRLFWHYTPFVGTWIHIFRG